MVSEMVYAKVRVDGHNVGVLGIIPISGYVIATPQMGLCSHNNIELLLFSVRVWSGMITI
jgi:hypothetical protein